VIVSHDLRPYLHRVNIIGSSVINITKRIKLEHSSPGGQLEWSA